MTTFGLVKELLRHANCGRFSAASLRSSWG